MNSKSKQNLSKVVALFAIAAAAPGAAQAANWNGWARCELTITGSGYSETETHTWLVSNVTGPSPTTAGPGNWNLAGGGSLTSSNAYQTERAEWALNGNSAAGRFTVLMNNGVATIRPVHSQLTQTRGITGYVQLTISGQPPGKPSIVDSTWWEYPFPVVQGPAAGGVISGSSNIAVAGWSFMRPSNSTGSAKCNWNFADGSQPTPPPAIPPVPTPAPTVPPTGPSNTNPNPHGSAAVPWTGNVICEATAAAPSSYQETQVHRWELLGGVPTATTGGYVHPVSWTEQGSGWSLALRERKDWTTNGNDKSTWELFIRTSDGKLVMQQAQPARVAVGGLQGTRQSSRQGVVVGQLADDVRELPLPAVNADPSSRAFRGRSNTPLIAPLSALAPASATGTSNCRWTLRQ